MNTSVVVHSNSGALGDDIVCFGSNGQLGLGVLKDCRLTLEQRQIHESGQGVTTTGQLVCNVCISKWISEGLRCKGSLCDGAGAGVDFCFWFTRQWTSKQDPLSEVQVDPMVLATICFPQAST
mmetsp:Transcript_72087/g.120640  ORF Transcript_72087/g.120640 Transcript_72087/m.120640 type:complete len:123 (+) Transcript_72087:40-408(+)